MPENEYPVTHPYWPWQDGQYPDNAGSFPYERTPEGMQWLALHELEISGVLPLADEPARDQPHRLLLPPFTDHRKET